jgi:hypothetical protein
MLIFSLRCCARCSFLLSTVTKDFSNVINEECGRVHTMSFTTSQFSAKILTDSSSANDEVSIFFIDSRRVEFSYVKFSFRDLLVGFFEFRQ